MSRAFRSLASSPSSMNTQCFRAGHMVKLPIPVRICDALVLMRASNRDKRFFSFTNIPPFFEINRRISYHVRAWIQNISKSHAQVAQATCSPMQVSLRFNLRCLFENIRMELTGIGGRNPPHTPSARLALNRSGKDDFSYFFGGKLFLKLIPTFKSLSLF